MALVEAGVAEMLSGEVDSHVTEQRTRLGHLASMERGNFASGGWPKPNDISVNRAQSIGIEKGDPHKCPIARRWRDGALTSPAPDDSSDVVNPDGGRVKMVEEMKITFTARFSRRGTSLGATPKNLVTAENSSSTLSER